ncbi:MAG: acyltransferase [Terracidiphilus sp.]
MESSPLDRSNQMPNLDLLRSIAVLLVVVEHTLLALRILTIGYWKIAWLGVVGVFMFFVHTSLVLMWSLDREPNTLGFYIRRFFRIYPLSIAAILILVIFRIPTMQNPLGDTYFQTRGIGNVFSNLLLAQNLAWGGNILGVMWTLPLEVDMYFLLPFLFFFLRKDFSIWPLLALWGAVAAYARATFLPDAPTFVSCIPYFLPGVFAYVLFAKVRPRLPALFLPVLIAAILSIFMINPTWRGGWILTFVLGMALPLFRQIRARSLIATSHQVAKYSYGIYLAHPFCIALGINYLHAHSMPVRLAAEIASLVSIVVISHMVLEQPMMDFGAKLARRVWKRSNGSRDARAEKLLPVKSA